MRSEDKKRRKGGQTLKRPDDLFGLFLQGLSSLFLAIASGVESDRFGQFVVLELYLRETIPYRPSDSQYSQGQVFVSFCMPRNIALQCTSSDTSCIAHHRSSQPSQRPSQGAVTMLDCQSLPICASTSQFRTMDRVRSNNSDCLLRNSPTVNICNALAAF